jgi:hypothetical protein
MADIGSSIIWRCPACGSTGANFAHRLTCASCGGIKPAPVDHPALAGKAGLIPPWVK